MPPLARSPDRRHGAARAAAAGLLTLAATAACGDAPDLLHPGTAATRAVVESPIPPSLLAVGYARVDSVGGLAAASTYNASGLRVDDEVIAPGHHRLTFVGL